MTYIPTAWILNSAPALTAIQLNRIEHGIDIAQGDVMMLYGVTAAIPATDPELVGRLYMESDLLNRVWRDNGAGWDIVIDPTCELLVTGQTTQYGGYADDGFYQRGTAKDYTVLTLGAYAGVTVITLNAKNENHSNNCVQDNVTGLMWSRTVSGPNVGPANNGLLPWTTNGAGEGIYTYIAAANAAGLAGYADWRVPNETELQSLKNMEAPNALPDAAAFPAWPNYVWTATSYPFAAAAFAMYVFFGRGPMDAITKTTTYATALVRG